MKKRRKKAAAAIFCLLCIAVLSFFLRDYLKIIAGEILYAVRGDTPKITVDFNNITGEMKSLHGINNGPKSGNIISEDETEKWQLDMTELYQSVDVPIVRLHDTEYPYGQDRFVDIHCIFPDMEKDVDDPSAYNFSETDEYIEAIIESGAEVFFRLGESIDHSGENKYINPPEDYMKWAQICEHIIRHYNEGWADGYHYNIVYWEIWNEPDNQQMWTGNMEQYYGLYRTTARYLKQIYPNIKVGGCAISDPSAENVQNFLQSLKADGEDTPLDFFSWHTYTKDPNTYSRTAQEVRSVLDENGYGQTESILDEWNYVENWGDLAGTSEIIHSEMGGAFIAASLVTMQKSPVDLAMYYDGQYALADLWCGLYDSDGNVEPGYYAFYFYDQLCKLGQQVEMEESLGNLYYCAAAGEKNGILLTNFSTEKDSADTIRLNVNGAGNEAVITRVNEENPNGKTTEENWMFDHAVLEIEAGEIIYIEIN